MESLTLERRLDHSNSDAEVTEPLAVITLDGIALQERLHDLQNLVFLDGAAEQLIESLTVVAAAEVHVVRAVGLADELWTY